jgi:hypothetical protein
LSLTAQESFVFLARDGCPDAMFSDGHLITSG